MKIPIKITKRLNNELIYDDLELRLDFLGLSETGELVNIEFQSTRLKSKDKERIGCYALITRIKEHNCVKSIIISTPKLVDNNTLNFYINNDTVFEIQICSLKDENGDKIQEELLKKIENNEVFNENDICDFILCPLMNINREIEDVIKVNVENIKKIKVSKEDQDFIESMMLLLINKFVLDDKKRDLLCEELKMKIKLIDEICDSSIKEGIIKGKIEGKEEGRIEGKEETKMEVAKAMIKAKYSEDEILKISKITPKQLSTLLKL